MDPVALGRFGLDVVLKASALLTLTALALLALRRATAATRHLAAVAGLAGALAMPGLALFLPRWELPVLPAQVAEKDGIEATVPAGMAVAQDGSAKPAAEKLTRSSPGIVAQAKGALIVWVVVAWAAVAAAVLARLVVGVGRVRRWAERAEPVFGEEWATPYRVALRALRMRRYAQPLVSDEVEVPMTAGALDPVVLLPEGSRDWPYERRRLVLLHELAHVKRHDWLAHLLCQASLAMWWFHPFAWTTAFGVRRDAEQAADDLVLRSGEKATVYASHLVDIVRALRPDGDRIPAMTMGRASGLEDRLRALLDRRPRGPASPFGRILAGTLGGLALALASAQPTARAEGKHWHSHDGQGWFHRGNELHSQGRYPEAIEAFKKAVDRGEREEAASYNIGCGYARMGDPDRAFEWLEEARAAGFDLSGYLRRDDDLASLRRDPRFRALAETVRAEDAADERSRPAKLAARFDRLLARAPRSAQPFYQIGKELLRADDYDRAARAFREAAARTDKPGASIYNAACALSLKGDVDGALAELRRAIESGFDDPALLRKDDDLDNVRGERQFAELVRMAEELEMPSMSLWNWTGRRSDAARWRDASVRFERYARDDPRSGRAFYSAGFARLAAGEPEAASSHFQRAVALGYRKSASLYNLACAEARLDHKDRAFDFLYQSLDAGYDDPKQLRGDADLDNLRGDPRYREALRYADRLASESND